ncbi:MAG: basic secretory protein-like protein [Bryobacter sp.]|nr:basic secretory protein-like protein [Bryobacter sp.]
MLFGLMLLVALPAYSTSPRIVIENTDPELHAFAQDAASLCQQWYPRINEILFGANPPKPLEEIRIIFADTGNLSGRAEANTMYLSSAEAKRPSKLDFRAVVIHELAHIVQGYQEDARCDGLRIFGCWAKGSYYSPLWIKEGIADYIAYTYFTKTNRPYLQINSKGELFGYDESMPFLYNLQTTRVASKPQTPAGKGYMHGYAVAASFLYWIEKFKDPDVIRKANIALRNKTYTDRFWKQHTKTSLDKLWAEFVTASVAASAK